MQILESTKRAESVACVQTAHIFFEPVDEQPKEPSFMEVFISQSLADSLHQQADVNRPVILSQQPTLASQPETAFYLYVLAHALNAYDLLETYCPGRKYRLESIKITDGANEGCRLSFLVDGSVGYQSPRVH